MPTTEPTTFEFTLPACRWLTINNGMASFKFGKKNVGFWELVFASEETCRAIARGSREVHVDKVRETRDAISNAIGDTMLTTEAKAKAAR